MEAQSTQAQIDLVYHGPDVESGSMEVRDLAPAMLAMAALFESAALVANGDRAKININLKSTSTNSFHIGLEILNTIGSQGVMDALHAASELKEILFGVGGLGGGGGVWWLINKLKRQKPEAVNRDGANVNITINGDNNNIEIVNVSDIVYSLYEQPKVRKATEDIAHIVKSEGIDAVEVQDNEQVIHRIDKSNVDNFNYDSSSDVLTDNVVRKVFTIVNLAFKENNKWRVSDGTTAYMASVVDTDVLARIDNNEVAFSKSGQLVCQFQTTQWLKDTGIRSEYKITKVEQYIPPSQLSLPSDPSQG